MIKRIIRHIKNLTLDFYVNLHKKSPRINYFIPRQLIYILTDNLYPPPIEPVKRSPEEEIAFQVEKNYHAVMGEARNDKIAEHLFSMIPPESKNILDLGCGSGYWTMRIAGMFPNAFVVGIDCGRKFIEKARHNTSMVVSPIFQCRDFNNLLEFSGFYGCVYADSSLEHSYNIEKTLAEIYRVLHPGGTLVAAFPADGLNPRYNNESHLWKTTAEDVRARLGQAGFINIEIEEIDIYLEFLMVPYPPSRDMVLFLRAEKPKGRPR